MRNPLLKNGAQMPFPQNSQVSNFMVQFQQFRNSFRGDAKSEVQRLLNSGEMTQEQFNQLHAMAQQIMGAK